MIPSLPATTHSLTSHDAAADVFARAMLIVGEARRKRVPKDDAIDGTLVWLSRKCTELSFNGERFEALMFMLENVANAWEWPEPKEEPES